MLKALFELLTSPLGLPIPIIWEYILLTLIEGVAFRIAWRISPGGPAGSFIHWIVRFIMFITFWGCAYVLIAFAKWVILNWVVALIVLVCVLFIICVIALLIKYTKKACVARERI